MAPARAPRAYLRQGLDKEVHQVITRLLEREGTPSPLDVATVYSHIQRSNSSLKRKGKPLLEDSIERALAVLQEDEEDEDSEEDIQQQSAAKDHKTDDGNAMNRSIMKSMKKQAARDAAARASEQPDTYAADDNGEISAAPTKKRRDAPSDPAKERSAKRSRWKDAPSTDPPTHVSLLDFGGSVKFIKDIKKSIVLPLTQPEIYMDVGISIPRGILLHGPPGCGKTMLAEAIAAEVRLPFLKISAPSIVSGMSGESEKQLRQVFEHAISLAPCLMFIDEIDAITPKRENAAREMERRIVAQLLTCLDDLALEKTNGRPVIVLAATNRPDSLDSALRRGGRFDKEINVGVPDEIVRENILRAQTRSTKVAPDVNFALLAKRTPGFVGADLAQLVAQAGVSFLDRALTSLEGLAVSHVSSAEPHANGDLDDIADIDMDRPSTTIPETRHAGSDRTIQEIASLRRTIEYLSSENHSQALRASSASAITMSDFTDALSTVQPSYKREGFATVPDTTWANIGALETVRAQLQNCIVEPIQDPESYSRWGLTAPSGVLLWGPPGCGKTLLAKAVANESQANFISVKGPELLNKYVGESERAVRQVFLRARSSTPCIIFFDELDALVPKRDAALTEASSRVVNTLLTELDGLDDRTGIYVIGATNRPDTIDPAMLRAGRLGKHLFVGLPGPDERVDILRTIIKSKSIKDSQLLDTMAQIGAHCERFSGADLSSLVYEAGLLARSVGASQWSAELLQKAREGMVPSISELDLRLYSEWTAKM